MSSFKLQILLQIFVFFLLQVIQSQSAVSTLSGAECLMNSNFFFYKIFFSIKVLNENMAPAVSKTHLSGQFRNFISFFLSFSVGVVCTLALWGNTDRVDILKDLDVLNMLIY